MQQDSIDPGVTADDDDNKIYSHLIQYVTSRAYWNILNFCKVRRFPAAGTWLVLNLNLLVFNFLRN
jgi:hypothetical protein